MCTHQADTFTNDDDIDTGTSIIDRCRWWWWLKMIIQTFAIRHQNGPPFSQHFATCSNIQWSVQNLWQKKQDPFNWPCGRGHSLAFRSQGAVHSSAQAIAFPTCWSPWNFMCLLQVTVSKTDYVPCLSVSSNIGPSCIWMTHNSQCFWIYGLKSDAEVTLEACTSNGLIGHTVIADGWFWKSLLTKASLNA